MTIEFRKKKIWTGVNINQLNEWILNSNYDILKNIHHLVNFDSFLLKSSKIIGIRAFLKNIPKFKFNNPQTIDYWLERGWSEEYGLRQKTIIKELQSKGIMYKVSKTKRLENAQKANKARVKQIKELQLLGEYSITNPTSIEYYTARGLNLKDARMALKDRQTTFSKKKMIDKHGEEIGLQMIQERNNKWLISLKENNDWDELSNKKSVTLEKMIEKYGENGIHKYNNWKKKIAQSKTNFINRYGEVEGLEKFYDMIEKRSSNYNFTSVESLVCFKPILDLLDEQNINYYVGEPNNKEYFLKSGDNIFFYDLTIPSLNKIVEYNGVAFHPRKSWDRIKWDNWLMPFKNLSADEKYLLDCNKNNVAKNNGFDLLEVWSDDLVSDIRDQIIAFLNLKCL